MPYQVMLAMPGPAMSFGACRGLIEASARHEVGLDNSGGSWDNFNTLWAMGLNRAAKGEISHFAMLHADVAPEAGWLDLLIEECDKHQADLVSAIVPLKDGRGITSSGVGRLGNPWGGAYRRIAIRELPGLPDTFDATSLGYGRLPLLHNNGCWVADLRRAVFTESADCLCENRPAQALEAMFAFPRRIVRFNGQWMVQGESEDWYFSRRLWELGARTYLTKRVRLSHLDGATAYPNYGLWGTQEHDEQTRCHWEPQ
jgi:hypothetical protein